MKTKFYLFSGVFSFLFMSYSFADIVICYTNNGYHCRYMKTSKVCGNFEWVAGVECRNLNYYLTPVVLVKEGVVTKVNVNENGSVYSVRNGYTTSLANVKTMYPTKDVYVDATLNSTETVVTLTFEEVVLAGQGKGRIGRIQTMEIKIADETSVTFSPNPVTSSSTIRINSDDFNEKTLEIFDISGKLVKSIPNIMSDVVNFDKENIKTGLYFYALRNKNTVLTRGKFSIE